MDSVFVVRHGFYRDLQGVHTTEQGAWDWVAEDLADEAHLFTHWPDYEAMEAAEYHVDEWPLMRSGEPRE